MSKPTERVSDEFVHELEVGAAHIDNLGHASNIAYVQWIQDAAVAHSSAAGWDHARYVAHQAVFVVRRHEVDYLRPVMLQDKLQIHTWVVGFRAATSVRSTRIMRSGELVAQAQTTWAFVDVETGRPCRIAPELKASFAACLECEDAALPSEAPQNDRSQDLTRSKAEPTKADATA